MSEQKRVKRPYVIMGDLKLTPCQFLSVMEDKPAALSLKDGGSILVWRSAGEFLHQRLTCSPIQALARWRKKELLASGADVADSDSASAAPQF